MRYDPELGGIILIIDLFISSLDEKVLTHVFDFGTPTLTEICFLALRSDQTRKPIGRRLLSLLSSTKMEGMHRDENNCNISSGRTTAPSSAAAFSAVEMASCRFGTVAFCLRHQLCRQVKSYRFVSMLPIFPELMVDVAMAIVSSVGSTDTCF